ncbi:hypothetical protein CC80DRAFT_511462 [Byssothecium circinans]|uniref:Uncharacterized protein n=1 Tax=Byssothecium circinans TaxID=147558 RepID=A0A6A5T7U6_9PLEO|nr:hypothetical protein CC80DRAFT_586255 [Byssothecium circinans]KAF1948280.1 hypothetical protein CC80DRAFT_511462 [Byssothecium circinans]
MGPKRPAQSEAIINTPSATPAYHPVRHERILRGDFGHGYLKSRLIFEADSCPPELRYIETTPPGYKPRLSATDKFSKWRQDGPISKIEDGTLRRNARLIYLFEHEPCGPSGEPSAWAGKLESMMGWVKKLMPDSYVVVRTLIPANAALASGQYRLYLEALRKLVTQWPYHFLVQFEDDKILTADVSSFYPTIADEMYNADHLRQSLTVAQVCLKHNIDGDGEAVLRQMAEDAEQDMRQAEQLRSGIKNIPINHAWIEQRITDKYNQWKEELVAEIPGKLADKCAEVDRNFAEARKLVEDLNFHRQHGFILTPDYDGILPPAQTQKRVKKDKIIIVDTDFEMNTELAEKVEKQAKLVVAALPWILEEEAFKHMEVVVKTKAKAEEAKMAEEEYRLEGIWPSLEILDGE